MPGPIKPQNMVGIWSTPILGVLRNMPIHVIPADGLYDSLNVVVRGGVLQQRPGLTTFVAGTLTGRPTGAFNSGMIASGAFQEDAFQNDAFQIAANVPATTLVVGTTRKIYAYFGGMWNDVTGTTLAATDAQLARFASLFVHSLGKHVILHVNGVDAPRHWDTTTATFQTTGGSPPATMVDIASVADHFVGIIPPYQLRWCNNQAFETWPAANVKAISDKGDPLIAIRAMGQYGAVVYGARSLWSFFPSGDPTESVFFTAQNRGGFDGPAGTQAVTDANGTHYWMTDTGRIGAFDGNSVTWVADGVWPVVDADMDFNNRARVFAVYEPRFKEVWFYYPRMGDNGDCKGAVCLVLPRPMDGIMDHIAFPMRIERSLSAGVDLRLDLRKSMVFQIDGASYLVEGANDQGNEFTGFLQTGLTPAPGEEMFGVSAFDVYCQRGGGFGSLSASVVSSFILDLQGGTISTTKTIDLTQTPVFEPFGKDVRGRFFGLKIDFTTPVTLRYQGARLAADPRMG